MIKEITLSTGETLFVEVQNIETAINETPSTSNNNLPAGARLTSTEGEGTTSRRTH